MIEQSRLTLILSCYHIHFFRMSNILMNVPFDYVIEKRVHFIASFYTLEHEVIFTGEYRHLKLILMWTRNAAFMQVMGWSSCKMNPLSSPFTPTLLSLHTGKF